MKKWLVCDCDTGGLILTELPQHRHCHLNSQQSGSVNMSLPGCVLQQLMASLCVCVRWLYSVFLMSSVCSACDATWLIGAHPVTSSLFPQINCFMRLMTLYPLTANCLGWMLLRCSTYVRQRLNEAEKVFDLSRCMIKKTTIEPRFFTNGTMYNNFTISCHYRWETQYMSFINCLRPHEIKNTFSQL